MSFTLPTYSEHLLIQIHYRFAYEFWPFGNPQVILIFIVVGLCVCVCMRVHLTGNKVTLVENTQSRTLHLLVSYMVIWVSDPSLPARHLQSPASRWNPTSISEESVLVLAAQI